MTLSSCKEKEEIQEETTQEENFISDNGEYSYSSFAGEYTDVNGKRATATITDNGNVLSIIINSADLLSEKKEWRLTATIQDGKLVYSDCVKVKILTDESGAEKRYGEYAGGSGYFEIKGDELLWNGTEDKSFKSCKFRKTE